MYTIQVLDNNTINKYIFRRYERKNEICTEDRNDKCVFHTDEEIDVYLFFVKKEISRKRNRTRPLILSICQNFVQQHQIHKYCFCSKRQKKIRDKYHHHPPPPIYIRKKNKHPLHICTDKKIHKQT
jgi:hypothetical protein